MSVYIHTTTGEYPLYEGDVRSRSNNVSFPETITEDMAALVGFAPVESTETPEGDVVSEGKPVLVNGKYKQTWEVRAFTSEEIAQQMDSRREQAISVGVPYTFPNGVEDHVKITDRDMTILTMIQVRARANVSDAEYRQVFRSLGNNNYLLTAQEVIDMTEHVFDCIQRVYAESWQTKDQ